MNTAAILKLIAALLPEAEELASIFIHNPDSQHQFSVVVGTVNSLLPVVAGLSTLSTLTTAAPIAAAAAAAAEPVIPAGVPSAHAA